MLLKVGTRASKLALTQTKMVIASLQERFQNFNFEIKEIITTGDKLYNENLSEIGGKGLFLKEIEEQLLNKEIDIAVHSMKDVPAFLPEGLIIPAVLKREDPRDCFISFKYQSIKELPLNSTIGTSSPRRKFQLLKIRPDLNVINFRGNVNTRIKKIEDGIVDGAIMAYAGMKRLGLDNLVSEILDTQNFLPAICQGTIGIECRDSDNEIIKLLQTINDQTSYHSTIVERAFLKKLEGDCKAPIAGHAIIEDNTVKFNGIFVKNGTFLSADKSGTIEELESIGETAANIILSRL
jgi:hydroxymethylbilane synthase